jgi:hypothetical protein
MDGRASPLVWPSHDVRHPKLISHHMGADNGNDSRIGTERHMNVEQRRIWRLIFSRE